MIKYLYKKPNIHFVGINPHFGSFESGVPFSNNKIMPDKLKQGDCVKVPDGRVGRVRDKSGNEYRIRVMRMTRKSHQFLRFSQEDLTKAACPKGWMSPVGYNRYLKITLEKMKKRERESKR